MRIYLAVPIIAHRQQEKAEAMAQVIMSLGHELISSWVVKDPGFILSASEVFERDLQGVMKCDVLVAEISHGSHGVGMEAMAAYLNGKKIIFLHEEGARVSHMLQGVPKAVFLSYHSSEDMAVKLRSVLLLMSRQC